MTKTINTYEEYVAEMKLQISDLMEKLYQYNEGKDSNKILRGLI